MGSIKNIYTIYANQDKQVLKYLLLHLQPLEKEFDVGFWSDAIYPEQQWKPENTSRLENADIFFLLVSNSFMYSEFIKQDEFKTVIDNYKRGTATVIPILVDDCPWDIEFTSDDYNFSFKELDVFPKNRKPIGDWNSTDHTFKQLNDFIRTLLSPSTDKSFSEEHGKDGEIMMPRTENEKQIAIDFLDDKRINLALEKENVSLKEVETKESVQEKNVLEEHAKAKNANKNDKLLRQKAEIQKRIEKEKKIKEKVKNEVKTEKKTTSNKVTKEEKAIDQRVEAENEVREVKYQEILPTKRESEPIKDVVVGLAPKAARKRNGFAGQNYQFKTKTTKKIDYSSKTSRKKVNILEDRKVRSGLLVLSLLIVGVWVFSIVSRDSEKPSTNFPESETTEIDVRTGVDGLSNSGNQAAAILELGIGDKYKGGIIFTTDPNNGTGKIASLYDFGPMPWQEAIKIDKQVGEGWRLPTLDELQKMYMAIGQGASNEGEFADGLYWSATPYDDYQARLLRFRDGNTSYHYNKAVEDRKFLVRPIRDFKR